MVKLSNSEELLMNIFWKEDRPLTSVELLGLATGTAWSSNYIHKLLSLLQEKGFIEMCGVIKDGKHYTRQFIPCFEKEEYISDMLKVRGVDTVSFAKIAVSLVKQGTEKETEAEHEKLIAELEKMIEEFKKNDK